MVYFKENYNFLRFQRGAGPTFSRGFQVLISIETNIELVIFQGRNPDLDQRMCTLNMITGMGV